MAKSLPKFFEREKTMNRIKNILTIAAFSFVVMGLPAIASAQNRDRDRDRDDDRYGSYGGYGNGGYYGNGQYGGYSNSSSAIRNLKSHTRDFQRALDRDLDRSRYNGTRREDQINEVAKRFRDAVNDLDNNGYYGNNGGYGGGYGGYGRNNDRYRRDDQKIRRVFDLASQIERSISRAQISYQTRNYWSMVRNDLQYVSRGYTYNNGNGNGNGGWGNGRSGGGRSGLPSWWPF